MCVMSSEEEEDVFSQLRMIAAYSSQGPDDKSVEAESVS